MKTKLWARLLRILAIIGYALFLLRCVTGVAYAHDVPASNVLLDIGTYAVQAELELPLNELREALGLPTDISAAQIITQHVVPLNTYIAQHIAIHTVNGEHYSKRVSLLEASHSRDGDWVIAHVDFVPPAAASTKVFVLDYDVIVANIITHNVLVSVRRDFRNAVFAEASPDNSGDGEKPLMIGLLHYQQKQITIDGSDGSWIHGFKKIFQLGMRHIAEGTDHVLFIFVLLLAAPLSASNRRWQRAASVKVSTWKIVKIVSAFTLGHSLTLVLGAIGVIRFNSTLIEVLIGLSIFISAVHALRPLFANREHYIAALFGLVHGMAFASSLAGFNYDSPTLALAVLGFNLGIEAMQLFIVALTLPSLLLMRTSPIYRYFRIGAATFTAVLAMAWMLERGLAIPNSFKAVNESLTTHALFAFALLAALAVVARIFEILRRQRMGFAGDRRIRINCSDPFNR